LRLRLVQRTSVLGESVTAFAACAFAPGAPAMGPHAAGNAGSSGSVSPSFVRSWRWNHACCRAVSHAWLAAWRPESIPGLSAAWAPVAAAIVKAIVEKASAAAWRRVFVGESMGSSLGWGFDRKDNADVTAPAGQTLRGASFPPEWPFLL